MRLFNRKSRKPRVVFEVCVDGLTISWHRTYEAALDTFQSVYKVGRGRTYSVERVIGDHRSNEAWGIRGTGTLGDLARMGCALNDAAMSNLDEPVGEQCSWRVPR